MVGQLKNKKTEAKKEMNEKVNEEAVEVKEEVKEIVSEVKTEIKNIEENSEKIIKNTENFFKKFINLLPDYLRTRFISAIVLIPIAIFIIYSSKIVFTVFVITMAILMAFEWITIVKTEEETNMWRILGLIYIILPSGSLVYIRNAANGADIVLWLFLVVWATDIAGLIVGKTVKGPKLAPSISPNKTWSGLIGGVLASMFVGLLSSVIFKESASFFIILSGILAIVEQASDLVESKFKRTFGVKDSGNIIPGHGGIMDRVDGLTLTAPVVALIMIFSSTVF